MVTTFNEWARNDGLKISVGRIDVENIHEVDGYYGCEESILLVENFLAYVIYNGLQVD